MPHRTESKSSPRRIIAKERQRQALELRLAGVTFDRNAETVGFRSPQAAFESVKRGLAAIPKAAAEELRTVDLERLDRLLLTVWPRAIQGEIDYIDRSLRILSQRARLMGYDTTPETSGSGQQLLPGQREITWRVVYDAPPDEKAAFDPAAHAILSLQDGLNGHSNPGP